MILRNLIERVRFLYSYFTYQLHVPTHVYLPIQNAIRIDTTSMILIYLPHYKLLSNHGRRYTAHRVFAHMSINHFYAKRAFETI